MEVRFLPVLLALTLLIFPQPSSSLDDLIAEESETQPRITQRHTRTNVTESTKKYSSRIRASENVFGLKKSPKKSVLDFRIEPEGLRASAAGNGKGKSDEDDEKTLSEQVAEGKYGLIQNELFPNGSKRPGIISYLPNPEVPRDTKDDFGGLDKDEIWLAEDHVLVLRGGRFPQHGKDSASTPWPPIDDYVAPTRQVEIPKNPKIPPPFPVQLTEGGPLEFIRGENGSLPPRPPYLPPFPPPGENETFPFPVPPGPLPPFLANLPPGAAFLPPPGNLTDFDEDDPSIYYPPRYDFFYPQDNTTAVPPGPLVPGIVLPPPPNFFSPEKPDDQENETDPEDNTTRPPFVGPAYLPSNDKKPTKPRTFTKRPPVDKKTTVTVVYPERSRPKYTKPPGFTSPIYVPNSGPQTKYGPFPPTTPRPNYISIPRNQTLRQEIYIVSTEPPEHENIVDFFKDIKPIKATTLENISPEIHPLRTLIRPNVDVSYIGKVGHLPPSTPFPFSRTESTTEAYPPPDVPGHFITFPPTVTVSEVPIVKRIRVRPTETATKSPHATLYFYEETPSTEASPIEENEVSASPIDQFLRENFKPNGPDYELKPVKTPLYLPAKIKTRIKTPTIIIPERPSEVTIDENPRYSYEQKKFKSTTPATVIIKHKQPLAYTPETSTVTNDGPFIPSNYYATANPETVHFTPLDHSLVDDITMKYFTIFGQKLNALGGTTPLTPIPPTHSTALTTLYSTTESPRYVKTEAPRYATTELPRYVTTESPKYVTPVQTPRYVTTQAPPPLRTPQYVEIATPNKLKNRPKSEFEQFLKEITGEDQKDYIVSQNVGFVQNPKKGKARPGFNNNPFFIPYHPAEISQYLENIYRPHHSTTLRPVPDVVQYQPQISSTYRPYLNNIPKAQPKPPSHNFGQFLQEVTYTGPKGPATSNLQFFDASSYSSVRQQYQPLKSKPVSLHNDLLVNFRNPLPEINPDAEVFDNTNSNIKVVQAPNLGNNRNPNPYHPGYQPQGTSPGYQPQRRPPQSQQLYDPPKNFFENLPPSGYFGPPQPGNAFVSYNLPGSGGHFYFLTPQAVDRSDSFEEPGQEGFGAVKRSSEADGNKQRRGRRGEQRLTNEQNHSGTGSTSQDYLRRRRKKP